MYSISWYAYLVNRNYMNLLSAKACSRYKINLYETKINHSDIGTTSNVYSDVDSESKKLSAEAIAKALSE